jgi:hypothetical protein
LRLFDQCFSKKETAVLTTFICLITLQFLVIELHDLIDVPGLITGSQVQAVMGDAKSFSQQSVTVFTQG